MADEEKASVEQSEEAEEQPIKVSRRDFLIGAGAGVVVTGALAGGYIALTPRQPAPVVEKQVEAAPQEAEAAPQAQEAEAAPQETAKEEVAVAEAEAPAEVVEPELPATTRAVTLNIDGKTYDVVVDVRESLWETMTYTLGLGSRTSLGCDRAQCGACGVVIDGRSINGCTVLSARLGRGQEILTVYSLAKGNKMEDLHPIQKAYIENLGVQCGICSRGFIMSTYALLSKNLNPTEEDIRKALESNICRCGNYTKVYASVNAAAEAMRAAG
jgi:aerobic-type carbon monoxide dehydrogenase small subunit (CoxS/CutS family)